MIPAELLDDPNGGAVLEDLLREQEARGELERKVSAAQLLWEARATTTQSDKERTLFVLDRHTTLESYPPQLEALTDYERRNPDWARHVAQRYGDWSFWFWRARQLMPMHPAARWFRVIRSWGNYRPKPGEVLLVRRKRRTGFFVDLRCGVEGCRCTGPLLLLVPT